MNPKSINFSFTLLKHLMRSPQTAIRLKEKPFVSSAEQLFNLAVECALQEPAKFEKEYKMLDVSRKGTNEWKAAEAKYGRGKVLKESEYDDIDCMRQEWCKNDQLAFVYSKGTPQLRLEWHYRNVRCKGFADWYSEAFPAINDIKVVKDASDEAVANIIARNHYDIQAAMYRAGAAAKGFHVEHSLITFVEAKYPYMVNAIEFTDEQLSFGHTMYMKYVEIWKECLDKNEYPGYGHGFHEINLPGWHTRKYLETYYE